MSAPAARRSRARVVQVVGAACVAIGLFLALLTWVVFHNPAVTRLGVGIVVIGAVLLAVAAVLRRIQAFRRRSG